MTTTSDPTTTSLEQAKDEENEDDTCYWCYVLIALAIILLFLLLLLCYFCCIWKRQKQVKQFYIPSEKNVARCESILITEIRTPPMVENRVKKLSRISNNTNVSLKREIVDLGPKMFENVRDLTKENVEQMIKGPHMDFRAGGFELARAATISEVTTTKRLNPSTFMIRSSSVVGNPLRGAENSVQDPEIMSSVLSHVITFESEIELVAECNRHPKINEHISEMDEEQEADLLPPPPTTPIAVYSDNDAAAIVPMVDPVFTPAVLPIVSPERGEKIQPKKPKKNGSVQKKKKNSSASKVPKPMEANSNTKKKKKNSAASKVQNPLDVNLNAKKEKKKKPVAKKTAKKPFK
ncbi:uncharacterized protein LOC134851466 isoform X2 [Symsagittifera roscoffensis]|uniref:uncharacterized protein LOC134851466 isoform X2 n=1 Tax=Symsagittifera roscoffensis TaxID=84072 RepID=UPI00307CA099